MSKASHLELSDDLLATDLQPHFTWRWREHGIYLAVCSVFVAMGTTLALLPPGSHRTIAPEIVELIRTRYQPYAAVAELPQQRKDLYGLRGAPAREAKRATPSPAPPGSPAFSEL
jgi:hypothetical protein